MRHLATTASVIAALSVLGSPARATVTVCNEAPAMIHVAFASQVNGSYTTTGWWSVPLNVCQDVDYTLKGGTLYFTADSDAWEDNGRKVTTHWGSDMQLYVSSNRSSKFNYTKAEKSRSGAKAETFQPDSFDDSEKLIAIKVHIRKVGSSVEFTSHP